MEPTIKSEKPKRSRIRISELVNVDFEIDPESQIYRSKIEEYRKACERKDWRNAVTEMEDVVEIEEPKKELKRKRGRKKKIPRKETSSSSDPDESESLAEDNYSYLIKKNITAAEATERRLDRLKRASEIEKKRLKEEQGRILADFSCYSVNDTVEPLEEDNNEITLRIRYMMDIFRIPTRQNEKFSSIILEISKKCDINATEILLCFKDRNINVDDTPSKLGIAIADIIDCFVYKPEFDSTKEKEAEDKNCIEVKIQASDSRKKTIMYVHKLGCMNDVMKKYADQRGIPLGEISFEFDGEKLSGSETPAELDMEPGSCIDARILVSVIS